MFKNHVTAHRRGITEEMMQGQCFFGETAVQNGLADGVVSCLQDVIDAVAA
jgi:ClpP class serine protease